MYTRDGHQVPNPDSSSGLYVRKQDGTVVQVRVPADHIAFQMGEAMQACPLLRSSLIWHPLSALMHIMVPRGCACLLLLAAKDAGVATVKSSAC